MKGYGPTIYIFFTVVSVCLGDVPPGLLDVGVGSGFPIGVLPITEAPCTSHSQQGTYDTQLMADTLEEAVVNFADLTLPFLDPELDKKSRKKEPGHNDLTGGLTNEGRCATDSCKHCSGLMLNRLEKVGMISEEKRDELAKKLNAAAKASSTQCKRLKLAENDTIGVPKHQRRLARSVEDGKRFDMRCVKAGELIVDSQPWIGFCDFCWVMTKLGEGHKPRYLNEVRLGNRSTCIGGHGICRQLFRNTDVRFDDGRKHVKKVIPMGRSVECNIKPDSDLLQIVRPENVEFNIQINT